MQKRGLEIIQQRPGMFAAGRERAEENIETQQHQAAGEPAAEKFPKNQLRPRQRLGKQGQQRPLFALRRDLPRGRGDGDDERGNPDEQEAQFLEIADDLFVVENIDGGHDQADEDGQNEQDVKILPAIQFLDDDAGDGDNIFHGVVEV